MLKKVVVNLIYQHNISDKREWEQLSGEWGDDADFTKWAIKV